MAENMTIIREFGSEMEALVAQSVLKANNIPAVLIRDNAGGMLPVLQIIYPVRIAVHGDDVTLALELLNSDAESADELDTDDDATYSPAGE